MLVITVLFTVWKDPDQRWVALISICAFFGASWMGSLYALYRTFKLGKVPFAATLDQLKKDRECLRK
jgi:uncharacterized membrane protein YqjE